MKDLSAWIRNEAERQRRIVHLEDALLGSRFWPYAFYRLRFFFLRYLAASLVHGVRFLFLLYVFPHSTFIALLLAHSGVSFISSFWWGGLEVMRARIRQLYRSRRPHLIEDEIARWLGLATLLSALTMLAGGIWLSWQMGRDTFGPAHLYGLSIFLRLACEFWTRCLHSGMYAIRRIYRPLWAIVGTELLSFGAVLALWPWLHAWSFPIGALLALVAGTAIVVHFTLRSYHLSGFLPLEGPVAPLAGLSRSVNVEFFAAGASYALMKMDAVLVLALFNARPAPADAIPLFILFFVMSPTVQAGFDWAQLFYFDLKRLEVAPLTSLRARYERSVARLAWAVGMIFAGLGCLIATIFFQRNLREFYGLLVPFFVSRSLLAETQIRFFADARYVALMKSGVAWLVGFALIRLGVQGDRERLLCISLMTLAVWAVLRHREAASPHGRFGQGPLGFTEWLACVNRLRNPARLGWVQLAADAEPRSESSAERRRYSSGEPPSTRTMAEGIARRLRGSGVVAVVHAGRIVWCELASRTVAITDRWVMSLGGGFVQAIGKIEVQPDGPSILKVARDRRLLGADLSPGAFHDCCVTLEEVEQTFIRMFPDGMRYAPDRPAPAHFDDLPAEDRRMIMTDAVAFARDFRHGTQGSRFDVTALCMAGELRLIFVVAGHCDRRLRSRWRRFVKNANLQAAFVNPGY